MENLRNLRNLPQIKGYERFLFLNQQKSLGYEEAEEMFCILTEVDLKKIQDHDSYTDEEREVYRVATENLYGKNGVWHGRIHPEYFQGIKRLGMNHEIFRAEIVSEILYKLTGFRLYFVPGHTKEIVFILALMRSYFPMTVWIRMMKELDYIEEPEMLHEGPGHLPLLTNMYYADATRNFAKAYMNLKNNLSQDLFAKAVELLGRLYWWTFEFGLTEHKGNTVIYGAGIASSRGEVVASVSNSSEKIFLPEDCEKSVVMMVNTPFKLDEHEVKEGGDEYFRKYFVTPSFGHFCQMMDSAEKVIGNMLLK